MREQWYQALEGLGTRLWWMHDTVFIIVLYSYGFVLFDLFALLCLQDMTNLYDMFHIRNTLHQRAIQHKTAIAVEYMWVLVCDTAYVIISNLKALSVFAVIGWVMFLPKQMHMWHLKERKGMCYLRSKWTNLN